MSSYANKSLKRKIEECEDDENYEIGLTKEVKRQTTSKDNPSCRSGLTLLRLSPEDWNPVAALATPDNEEEPFVEDTEKGSVSRGTLWTGKDGSHNIHGLPSQLSVACKRFPNGSSSFDCETQTYYFVPNSDDEVSNTNTSFLKDIGENAVSDKDNLVKVCCVVDCKSQSSEVDSSTVYYRLPSDNRECSLWAEILRVEFVNADGDVQEICSKHFVVSASLSQGQKDFPAPKSSCLPKAKTRKKRTCDILIAEEAEKVKQSMVTGRSKRTPKPNRNYDWAELTPLVKGEADDLEEVETTTRRNPIKQQSGPGRRRKQLLDEIRREEKENEQSFREVHLAGFPDLESEDYGVDISLPSMPRAPPPKSKGRPHRIQDTCTQTDIDVNSSRGPLREVKVQCNLTAEPLVTCSSCSNIDWQRLDEQLANIVSVIEGDRCNPMISRYLKKLLGEFPKPSHAANVLRAIAGVGREILESGKDIVLVSSQDEFDEVEIENVIHQEEAPITGVREITPKLWNKKGKGTKERRVKNEEISIDDADSLGLKEATERDDDEFQPEYALLKEEEEEYEDDDLDEMDEDDDWDIKNEDETGVPITKKKKPRQKTKKGHQSLGGEIEGLKEDETQVHAKSPQADGRTEIPVCVITNLLKSGESSDSVATQKPVERKINRKTADDRWRRGTYQCPKCNKNFTTRLKMDRHHQYVHLGIAPWKGTHLCEECGRTFTQKVGLRVHRMHKHGDPKLFDCSMCNFKGATKTKLTRHLLSHYDDKIYSCEVCGMALKTQDTYKNHMSLHTNEGKYQCDVCQRAFHHKQYYEDHRKSHFNVRNFHCDICHTAFKTHKSLRTHVRGVHLNDKRIICRVCGARFMTNYNLRTHMKKHERAEQSGAKYPCNLCTNRFHSEAGLDTHKRVTHPDYYQPIQIKVESCKSTDIASIFNYILKTKDEILDSETSYTAEVEHVIQEMGSDVISDKISDCFAASESVGPIETVEAVLEDCGEGVKEHISVVYVFPCNSCGSMFRSQDLLNIHKHSVHLT